MYNDGCSNWEGDRAGRGWGDVFTFEKLTSCSFSPLALESVNIADCNTPAVSCRRHRVAAECPRPQAQSDEKGAPAVDPTTAGTPSS